MTSQECVICFDEGTRQSELNLFKHIQNARNGKNRMLQLCMSNCGCNGYIHSKCLLEWIEQNQENRNKCPICRTVGQNFTLEECFPQSHSKESSGNSSPVSVGSIVNVESSYQSMPPPLPAPPPVVIVHSATTTTTTTTNTATAPTLPIVLDQRNRVILIRFLAVLMGILLFYLMIGIISED